MKESLARKLHKVYWERSLSFRQLEAEFGIDKDKIRYAFTKYGLLCRSRKKAVRIAHRRGDIQYNPRRGAQHPAWVGGRRKTKEGYIQIRMPSHPRAQRNGYVFEHHLVWEREHGMLPKGWHVHHINGIKSDNRIENLRAMPAQDHMRYIAMQQEKIRDLEAEIVRLRKELESRQKLP